MQLTEKHREYWKRNLNLTLTLLAIWFVVTFVMANIAGFPFSFYMAAQGSLIIYIVIIAVYAKKMGRLDEEYGVHEGDD